MRARAVLLTLVLGLGLTMQQSAFAKGAWSATLSGPGLDSPVVVGSKGGRDVARVANLSGMYAALFETQPSPMLDGKPDQDLGPRFVIAYHFDAPNIAGNVVRQDVYPYARPHPVTYLEPGQPVFNNAETFGGWYEASPRLLRFLVSEGLPDLETAASETREISKADGDAAAPAAPSRSDDASRADRFPVVLVVAAVVVAGLAVAVVARRRLGSAHA